jgi:hypothetical protein
MGRNVPDYFEFTPYLYGPCSFEFYDDMQSLENEHLISSSPHPVSQWASYYLTPKGKDRGLVIESSADPEVVTLTKQIANEVSSLGFRLLLKRVYKEAPDFAINTVMPWRIES